MTCHHSQTFRELVENLYEEFKELKEKEIFFTCGGLTMDLDKYVLFFIIDVPIKKL